MSVVLFRLRKEKQRIKIQQQEQESFLFPDGHFPLANLGAENWNKEDRFGDWLHIWVFFLDQISKIFSKNNFFVSHFIKKSQDVSRKHLQKTQRWYFLARIPVLSPSKASPPTHSPSASSPGVPYIVGYFWHAEIGQQCREGEIPPHFPRNSD